MTIELACLFGAMVLGLVHIGAASFSFKAQVGDAYTVGPRDEGLAPHGLAGRLDRASRNFRETFAIFAAAVLATGALGLEGAVSATGAVLYLVGRAAYLPLYATGWPWARTLSWNVATLGAALVLIQPFLPR